MCPWYKWNTFQRQGSLLVKHNLIELKVMQWIGRVLGSLPSANKQPWSSYGLVICGILSFVGKHTLATQGWAF